MQIEYISKKLKTLGQNEKSFEINCDPPVLSRLCNSKEKH